MTETEAAIGQHEAGRFPAWWRYAMLGAAGVFLQWHTLHLLVRRWYHEPDYTYGFFVPLVSLYLVWRNRSAILTCEAKPSPWGGLILCTAFVAQFLGMAANIGYLQGLSLLVLIAGIVVLLGGRALLRVTAFPILYLWLMIPLPGAVYTAIASPLQSLASYFSANILELLGIPVFREGNVFRLVDISLEVAEACSGLRSLVGLLSMGILLGYLTTPRLWERILLAVSTIPIAVAANVARVAGTGIIYEHLGPKYGRGFYHGFGAWVVFVFALAVLLLEAPLLSALFVEHPEKDAAPLEPPEWKSPK